jgi:hypothetical protein
MAGVRASVCPDPIACGTSEKCVLQITAAANHAVLVHEIGVWFQGTSNTAKPPKVQIVRQSSAGSGGTSITPKKDPDDASETVQTTALYDISSLPTEVDVIKNMAPHPQTGFVWQAAFDKPIKVGGGDRLGIVVTAEADVPCLPYINFEE